MRISDFEAISEIKALYRKCREEGFTREVTVEGIIYYYQNEINLGEDDDAIIFWIALADAQYACKELSQEIADKGKEALDRLQKTDWAVAEIDILRRKKYYAMAPMPARKSIKAPKRFHCSWNIGDTFAYQLSDSYWEQAGLLGSYILLRKVANVEADGYIFPAVSLCVWPEKPFPATSAELQQAALLRLERGRNGAPRSKYEYRVQILFTKEAQLKRIPFEYVGRFEEIVMPEDEVVFSDPGEIAMIYPPQLEYDLFLYWKRDQDYRNN